jgi:hypothetical protein
MVGTPTGANEGGSSIVSVAVVQAAPSSPSPSPTQPRTISNYFLTVFKFMGGRCAPSR